MIIIAGNTYDHRDTIRSAGAKWDAQGKYWTAADDNVEIAKLLVQLVGPTFRASGEQHNGATVVRIPRTRRAAVRDDDPRPPGGFDERQDRDAAAREQGAHGRGLVGRQTQAVHPGRDEATGGSVDPARVRRGAAGRLLGAAQGG